LTGWPVTREAAVLLDGDQPDTMFVQYRNHVPLAQEIAGARADVHWGGASTIEAVADALARRRSPCRRVGLIGPLPFAMASALGAVQIVPLERVYTRLRMTKSAEELDWLRIGAWFSDLGMAALRDGLRVGMSEREVIDLIERAYVPSGGATHIHYVGTTSMHAPACCVPAQYPSARRLAVGDAVVVELSAAFWDYAGQVLRTFTIEEPPTSLYARLHAVAETALAAMLAVVRDGTTPRQLQDAAGVIEDAGFTTCDDLVHGFGGGYLPPVIASAGQAGARLPDVPLAVGMTVVVQPNVVTPDLRAGVQTGELVHVTAEGFERLHRFAPGLQIVTGRG
jgi:Xaa-Pro aminopeptidase